MVALLLTLAAGALAASVSVPAAVTLAATEPAASPAQLPGLVLEDQYGGRDGPGLHRGRVIVLIYGRPSGLKRMQAWERSVSDQAGGDVSLLRAVDARARVRRRPDQLREKLKDKAPAGASVLIDREGELAEAYFIPAGQVSLTVIDATGKGCGTLAGPPDPELLHRAIELIVRVKYKGECP